MPYTRISVDSVLPPSLLSREEQTGLLATVEHEISLAVGRIVATGCAAFVGHPKVIGVPGAGDHLVQIDVQVRPVSAGEDIVALVREGAVYRVIPEK